MSETGPRQRVALVTGGAGGIGRAICEALAAAGHAVAVADLDLAAAEAVASELDTPALGVCVDVTDGGSVQAGAESVAEALGPVEIAVNNAGWDELVPFLETDEELWNRVIEINFKGALRVTRAVLPAMLEAEWGRLVNIGSDAGRVGSSLESVYSGAKGGLVAFTKTIARETARNGVTANCVCPGPTRTPLLEGMAGEGESGAKLVGALQRAVPMGRLGEPADVAGAVRYFSSEEASYVTGQTLSVSGGLTMA